MEEHRREDERLDAEVIEKLQEAFDAEGVDPSEAIDPGAVLAARQRFIRDHPMLIKYIVESYTDPSLPETERMPDDGYLVIWMIENWGGPN